MRIIPVIDVLDGVVVHAVKGERSQYKPLHSRLCSSADPVAVAKAFWSLGFRELYIADLDAILGREQNFWAIEAAAMLGLNVMVDAGVADLKCAKQVFEHGAAKVIIGTETLTNLTFINETLQEFGHEHVIVSLDLKNGAVLSKSTAIQAMPVLSSAIELDRLGVAELIVLDLARVGSSEGVDVELLGDLTKKVKLKVLVGGGIRDLADLNAIKEVDVDGVLLATALHTGKITIEQLHLPN
jgi:phosphoribosylformimino-5-aminoimidazole carboxamide ribotide isomerase